MRTFIGIPINSFIKDKLEDLQKSFIAKFEDIKWTEKNNLHITLIFLGEIEEKDVNPIKNAIAQTVKNLLPFSVSFKGVGGFPSLSKTRIIYVDIIKNENKLREIFTELKKNLMLIKNFDIDNSFSPHITIGRVKKDFKNLSLIKLNFDEEEQMIETVNFYESVLSSAGPVYKIIKEFSLVKE